MKSKSIFLLSVACGVFLLCLLPVAYYTYKHPAHNWDMLAYMALISRAEDGLSPGNAHARAYADMKNVVPPAEYEQLTNTPAFRKKFADDPAQFEKLLPMYAVKPLYIWACRLFYKAGFSLPASTVMPSILAYLLTGVFLFYWLSRYLKILLAFPAGLLIMCSMPAAAVAGLSTPDLLSALFLFIGAYFILGRRNAGWMFIFFLLAAFTRVDNLLVCFFVISFLRFSKKWKRINTMQYLLMLAALGIAYIAIVLPVTQYGWPLTYYSRFSRQLDFSWDFDQGYSFTLYRQLVYSKLVTGLVSSHFTLFLFGALLVIAGPGDPLKKMSFDKALLLVLLSALSVRFLLLPDLADRFYSGYYLIIIILLIKRFSAGNLIEQS